MFRTFPYVFVFEFRKASQNLDIMNHDARRQLKENFYTKIRESYVKEQGESESAFWTGWPVKPYNSIPNK